MIMSMGMLRAENLGAVPILVGCEHRLKAIWAMAVDMKGSMGSAVR